MQSFRMYSQSKTLPPALPRWDRKDILESTEIIRRDTAKLMEDLDPYEVCTHDPIDISTYVLRECAKTLDRPA